MGAKEYIQGLKAISQQKLALFNEILMFTKTQNEVIKNQRFEEIDQLIKERQQRMDAIDKLDEQFVVYSSKLKEAIGIVSFEELPKANMPGTSELKNIILEIQKSIAKIKQIDDENTSLVKTEMKNTRENIDNTNAHKRATGAYYPPDNTTSYYFDKKK